MQHNCDKNNKKFSPPKTFTNVSGSYFAFDLYMYFVAQKEEDFKEVFNAWLISYFLDLLFCCKKKHVAATCVNQEGE